MAKGLYEAPFNVPNVIFGCICLRILQLVYPREVITEYLHLREAWLKIMLLSSALPG